MTACPKPSPSLVIPEYRAYIAGLPCLICLPGDQTTRTEVCHVHTRRNAGDVANLVPMCTKHHTEQHFVGIRSFEARHATDLQLEATMLWTRWKREAKEAWSGFQRMNWAF